MHGSARPERRTGRGRSVPAGTRSMSCLSATSALGLDQHPGGELHTSYIDRAGCRMIPRSRASARSRTRSRFRPLLAYELGGTVLLGHRGGGARVVRTLAPRSRHGPSVPQVRWEQDGAWVLPDDRLLSEELEA